MELERLSKDELIYIIRRYSMVDMERIEFDVLTYRSQKCICESNRFAKKANELLSDYIELMRTYEGEPLSSVQGNGQITASQLMEQRETYIKKEQRKNAEYIAIRKRIDIILNRAVSSQW